MSPRTPPFAQPQNPGNQMDVAPSADFNPDEQRLRDLLAHPPQEGVKNDGTKIGGLRRVLGEIAQNVGPLIGGPAVAGIGQKLLNPGLEKWSGDVARAQGLAQLSQTAEARHNLQINRDLNRQQAEQGQTDREQNALTSFEGRVPGTRPVDALPPSNQLQSPEMFRQGVDNIGRVGLPSNQTNVRPQSDSLQPGQPVTSALAPTSIPATTVEDQVGPGYSVQRMPLPGSRGKQQVPYAVPTPRTIAQNAADAEGLKRQADKTEEISPELEQQLKSLEYSGPPRAGSKVTPAEKDKLVGFINSRLNSRDTIAAKPEPPSKETENQWIADSNSSDPVVAAAAEKKLARLRKERPPAADHGVTMIGGDGKVYRLEPGQQMPEGARTAAGVNSENVPTAQSRSMAEAAPKVIGFVDRINQLIDAQEKDLGPASGRLSEFLTGKIGTKNKEYTKLRTDVGLLQTALMRMHVGARGGEQMMQHFKDLIDASKQDPDNLRAALGEIKAYAQSVGVAHGAEPTNAGGGVVTWTRDASGNPVPVKK